MADIVSADYNQLSQVASQFTAQGEAAKQALTDVTNNMQVLVGGGWISDAASAFYDSMNNEVLPGLNRLINALNQGGTTTQSVIGKLKNAEQEARSMLPTA